MFLLDQQTSFWNLERYQSSKLPKVNVFIENKSKSHHRKSFDLVEQVQWYSKVKAIFMGLPIEKSYFSL